MQMRKTPETEVNQHHAGTTYSSLKAGLRGLSWRMPREHTMYPSIHLSNIRAAQRCAVADKSQAAAARIANGNMHREPCRHRLTHSIPSEVRGKERFEMRAL